MKRTLSSLAVLGAVVAASGAQAQQPRPWQMTFQPAATGMMEQIAWFEHYTLWFIVPITLLVLALLAYCIFKFRASVNPTPSRTSHNTIIEVIWTVGPVVVLLFLAIPSFQLLTAQYNPPEEPEADAEGDRQPVELGLRVPDRAAAFVQFADARRGRSRRQRARPIWPPIRGC